MFPHCTWLNDPFSPRGISLCHQWFVKCMLEKDELGDNVRETRHSNVQRQGGGLSGPPNPGFTLGPGPSLMYFIKTPWASAT